MPAPAYHVALRRWHCGAPPPCLSLSALVFTSLAGLVQALESALSNSGGSSRQRKNRGSPGSGNQESQRGDVISALGQLIGRGLGFMNCKFSEMVDESTLNDNRRPLSRSKRSLLISSWVCGMVACVPSCPPRMPASTPRGRLAQARRTGTFPGFGYQLTATISISRCDRGRDGPLRGLSNAGGRGVGGGGRGESGPRPYGRGMLRDDTPQRRGALTGTQWHQQARESAPFDHSILAKPYGGFLAPRVCR